MSLSAFVKELRAAGVDDSKIVDALVGMEAERQAKGRARVAKHRAAKRIGNVGNVTPVTQNGGNVGNVGNVTQNDENQWVTESRARTHVGDNLLPLETSGEKERTSLRSVARESEKPSSHRKPRTSLPSDWEPSENGRQYAASRGLHGSELRVEVDKFRNHHTAHGKQMASWDAAWRTWSDNFANFKPRAINGNGRRSGSEEMLEELARRAGRGTQRDEFPGPTVEASYRRGNS